MYRPIINDTQHNHGVNYIKCLSNVQLRFQIIQRVSGGDLSTVGCTLMCMVSSGDHPKLFMIIEYNNLSNLLLYSIRNISKF